MQTAVLRRYSAIFRACSSPADTFAALTEKTRPCNNCGDGILKRLLGIFLTSDFASFLPALRCFFRQDLLGIDSKSASIGQKILQNQSATKNPNSL
jgi:hypothetical protein